MQLKIRLQIEPASDEDNADPVYITVTGGGPKAASLGASLALHALFLLLLLFVSRQLAFEPEERVDFSKYDLEMIRINANAPLYFGANQGNNLVTALADQLASATAGQATGFGGLPAMPPSQPALRGVQLPVPRHPMKGGPVTIQPDPTPQPTPIPAALPPMVFWARRDPAPAPSKPPVPEVVPGRTEKSFTLPKLAGPPSPQVPNQEKTVAELNVSLPAPSTALPSQLAVRNSATMLVRMREAKESVAASFDRSSGQPVNVLALAAEWKDIRNVAVPKGLQNVPAEAAAANGAGGAAVVTRGSSQAGPTGQGAKAHAVIRIDHPSNGNFDVVIMQSATRDDVLAQGEKLSGNPVYSVYLRVGDQKEWILEYCVPGALNVQAGPYQISIDEGGLITPPYPISTVIPNSVLGQTIPKHIVLHGYLSSTGSLRAVKAPHGTPLSAEILTFLGQWRFRPALRNRSPIEVEILLLIPARG